MKSYHLEAFGTIEGIRIKEHEMPQPGPSEVLIAIKATSLNRRDLYILHQTYPLPGRPGVIPLSDGAGEVIAVGSAVTRFKHGDKVCGNYFAHPAYKADFLPFTEQSRSFHGTDESARAKDAET